MHKWGGWSSPRAHVYGENRHGSRGIVWLEILLKKMYEIGKLYGMLSDLYQIYNLYGMLSDIGKVYNFPCLDVIGFNMI